MASTRKLILKAEYNFLAKVHWMTADDSSRKHEEKTFLPNPNAQEYVKQLFKESSLSPKDVKAIAFIYNDCEFDTWQKAYEFRRGCYEFCQKNGIFYHSSTTLAFHNFIATLRSKAVGKEGDHLTVIYAEMMGVLGKTFVRRNGQWKCMNVHMTSEFQNTQEWKHQFLKNYTPKKIIFMYHMAAFDFQQ
uniref:SnoaL-like domain-containing protein n=1 Tax=Panagrolaimus sp. ES5 TaxID=591445 RepID=A0AC34G0R6_9BILA